MVRHITEFVFFLDHLRGFGLGSMDLSSRWASRSSLSFSPTSRHRLSADSVELTFCSGLVG